jgi:hypothetical protein
MKKQISVLVLFSLLLMSFFTSCSLVTEKPREDYLNAGDDNLSVTGKEFGPSTQFRHQFTLYRFDTANASHTLTLPNAAQIIGELTTPYVGELVVFGVAADGANPVIIEAGADVAVKPSAKTVPGNTTSTIYCVLENVTQGKESITIY